MSPYTSVTGVMVMGKDESRIKLARRAAFSWQRQTYLGRRELLIVNDHPELRVYPNGAPDGIREHIVPERLSLGALRNIGIEQAQCDYLVQWDDDDFSHPNRLIWQAEHTQPGVDSTLRYEVHYDDTAGTMFVNDGASIRGCGFPGTMMWPRLLPNRFPEIGKREDMEFIEQLKHQRKLLVLENEPIMYCRIYHGDNTWGQGHVMHRKAGWRDINPAEQQYLQQLIQQLKSLVETNAATI